MRMKGRTIFIMAMDLKNAVTISYSLIVSAPLLLYMVNNPLKSLSYHTVFLLLYLLEYSKFIMSEVPKLGSVTTAQGSVASSR